MTSARVSSRSKKISVLTAHPIQDYRMSSTVHVAHIDACASILYEETSKLHERVPFDLAAEKKMYIRRRRDMPVRCITTAKCTRLVDPRQATLPHSLQPVKNLGREWNMSEKREAAASSEAPPAKRARKSEVNRRPLRGGSVAIPCGGSRVGLSLRKGPL